MNFSQTLILECHDAFWKVLWASYSGGPQDNAMGPLMWPSCNTFMMSPSPQAVRLRDEAASRAVDDLIEVAWSAARGKSSCL